MPDKNTEYVAVARISGTFGYEGWLRVTVYSGIDNRFGGIRLVFLADQNGMQGHILSQHKQRGGQTLIKLKDVDNKEDGRELIGSEIFLPENEIVQLPEDHYFIHDLIGMAVFDEKNQYLGVVREVLTGGGQEVFVVKGDKEEILIPAVSAFVKIVDVGQKRMTVRLWEEM